MNGITNSITPVIPPSRVDSDIISVHSEIKCQEPGLCKSQTHSSHICDLISNNIKILKF